METKNVKKHPVLSIPVLGSVLLALHAYMAYGLVFACPGALLDQYIAGGAFGFESLFAAIGGILVLFIHKFWFRDEFKGCVRKDYGDRKFKWLVTFFILFDLAAIFCTYLSSTIAIPTVKLTFMALMAGIGEEVTFRALPISLAMRNSDNKKCIIIAVAVSSFLFGIFHSLNALAGGDVLTVTLMVIRTFGKGVLYAAIFLRTGNILITIVMHVFHDYIAFFAALGNTDVTPRAVTVLNSVVLLAYTIITVVVAVLLLKGHSDEIMDVWRERWNKKENL